MVIQLSQECQWDSENQSLFTKREFCKAFEGVAGFLTVKKREEKKIGAFAKDLQSKVRERVKKQSELVQKYKDDGKFDFDVNDRFSTPFTRERKQAPYKVIGHFVDTPSKGGPTKHGYYVERKYGEGKDDVERHKINIHPDHGFQKIEPLKSIKEDSPAWQKSAGKDPEGGLNKKGVESYRREHPGSKLQTAVTTEPSKLKPGSKKAKRRLSFCRRMKGLKSKLTSKKTANDPNSRVNKSLRKWNCQKT